jgi:hypothetical protein
MGTFLLALLCVACCLHVPLCAAPDAATLEEVALTPDAPVWSTFFAKLPELPRPLRVASPCMGIHGCGQAFLAMGSPIASVHNYDLEARYRPYLEHHLAELGMDAKDVVLNLGREAGNLLMVPLSTIARSKVDLLIAGPPCPPWSSCGKKQGLKDPKAKVFIRILQWALVMIKCCGLLGLVLENVVGITYETHGREPVVFRFLELMKRPPNPNPYSLLWLQPPFNLLQICLLW